MISLSFLTTQILESKKYKVGQFWQTTNGYGAKNPKGISQYFYGEDAEFAARQWANGKQVDQTHMDPTKKTPQPHKLPFDNVDWSAHDEDDPEIPSHNRDVVDGELVSRKDYESFWADYNEETGEFQGSLHGEEASKYLHEHLRGHLNSDYNNSVQFYTGDGFRGINTLLRHGESEIAPYAVDSMEDEIYSMALEEVEDDDTYRSLVEKHKELEALYKEATQKIEDLEADDLDEYEAELERLEQEADELNDKVYDAEFDIEEYRDEYVESYAENNEERFIEEATEKLRDHIDEIRALFENAAPIERSIKVYRGVAGDVVKALVDAEGEEFVDAGFLSTSTDLDFAKTWVQNAQRSAIMEIKVPNGTRVLYPNEAGMGVSREKEVMLANNSTLKIESIRKEGFTHIITATYGETDE